MSWTRTSQGPIGKHESRYLPAPDPSEHAPTETGYQFAAALRAVADLCSAVGRPDDQITVNMSGHANPRHAPAKGWGNEYITVTVTAQPVIPESRTILNGETTTFSFVIDGETFTLVPEQQQRLLDILTSRGGVEKVDDKPDVPQLLEPLVSPLPRRTCRCCSWTCG